VDFGPPVPSYQALSDGDMWGFYGPKWDRRYSLAAARSPDIARACNLYNEGAGPLSGITLPVCYTCVYLTYVHVRLRL
jgi:hypothetical protein